MLAEGVHQALLVLAAGDDRLSRDAEHDDIAALLGLWGVAFDDVDDDFFLQLVIFSAIFLQFDDILLEGAHFFLIAQHLDDVAPCHDAQFGVECLDELHVGVIYAVENDGVYVFEYNQFFYHSVRFLCYFPQR